ncbi:MAG: malto-oligosyltrehalose trehalohydrolase [Candidatus Sulfotelmatobacter sp.]
MPSSGLVDNLVRLGANRLPDGRWAFLVWAPKSASVSVRIRDTEELIPMQAVSCGYHHAALSLDPGTKYLYRLEDGRELPDPASRFQPDGVHGPSQLVDTESFQWTDQSWKGHALAGSIFYELHVGTYTPEGTFDALIPRLDGLVELGVTTIELMPVAQFPGPRNWGYDGVYPFAPQNSYGGSQSLQRLVNAAHARGLSVALDVVYNHLGPEGNYLTAFGPYFTDRYRTPWGQAINFDGEYSDEVRRFFIENARYWLEEYHLDALRLDAVHGIFDFSARHFLAELQSSVSELSARLGRPLHLIAESDLNDSRLLHDPAHDGYGLDAQWSDDFHHSVHTLLTRENRGYYSDFGGITPLAETLRHGWFYRGQVSNYRKRRHGNSPEWLSSARFVVCCQNHDQVGNRAAGERLTALVGFEALKLAAGITLLSPFVPLLFMGEEYGESAPFQYFTSHGDPGLVEAVRRGRREEFAAFGWQETVPDPQDKQTFLRSRPNPDLKSKEPHRTLYHFYQELIRIRAELKFGSATSRTVREVSESALLLSYESNGRRSAAVFNFSQFPSRLKIPELAGNWKVMIHSAARRWNGPEPDPAPVIDISADKEIRVSPYSFLMLEEIQSSQGV